MYLAPAAHAHRHSGTQPFYTTSPVDLTLSSRDGANPISYVATDYIDLVDGFTSNTNDDVTAYVADAAYAGGGNGEGSLFAGSGKYRYGFNGKENDNEVKGFADQIDYGMRVYDPRVGKFMSVDQLTKGFPMLTPYQYASNSPIDAVDLDGLEGSFLSDFKSLQAKKMEDISARLSTINSEAVQARNRSLQQKANAIFTPPKSDHVEVETRLNNMIANIDYNKPENAMARYNQRSVPTVGAMPPPQPANEYEAGAVNGVKMATIGVAAHACPTCFLLYGGAQTYSGIKNKDAQQIVDGGLNMTVGLLGMAGSSATETFYRAMSRQDFAVFQKTGKMPATGETMISPTKAFSDDYRGVLVEFNTKAGTYDQLKQIGVRNVANDHPHMDLPIVRGGWGKANAYFKFETDQVNIGLGQGKALDLFNSNIKSYKVLRK